VMLRGALLTVQLFCQIGGLCFAAVEWLGYFHRHCRLRRRTCFGGRRPCGRTGRVLERALGSPYLVRQNPVLLPEPLDFRASPFKRVFAVGQRGDGLGEFRLSVSQPFLIVLQAGFQIPVG